MTTTSDTSGAAASAQPRSLPLTPQRPPPRRLPQPAAAGAAAAGAAAAGAGAGDAFDPRPLRIAAVIAVLFLAVPGSLSGAALLWVIGHGELASAALPLLPASTHAMLQLAGGFGTLIVAFLACGVPHLLGLDPRRARRVLIAIVATAGTLAVDVVALLVAQPPLTLPLALAARLGGLVAALGIGGAFVAARRGAQQSLAQAPLPFLVAALALLPFAWLAYAAELVGWAAAGLGGDLLLYLVVAPVVMSMGWKMFSAMLQLDAGDPTRLFVGVSSWLVGGLLVVSARWAPGVAPFASPFLLCGALAWLASLHGLRRRRGGLALIATAGPELRVHVVIGAAALIASPLVWALAGFVDHRGAAALHDFARHLLAIGFVLTVTMGVTLRALPRFCRGRPSSPRLALLTLAVLVTGLGLRAGRIVDDAGGAGAAMLRVSAVLTLAAVVVWGAHLLRGLREEAPAVQTGASERMRSR